MSKHIFTALVLTAATATAAGVASAPPSWADQCAPGYAWSPTMNECMFLLPAVNGLGGPGGPAGPGGPGLPGSPAGPGGPGGPAGPGGPGLPGRP